MSGLTTPFDPAWSSRLGGSLTPRSHVEITGSGLLAPITLDVISGVITFDEDMSPAVSASLQCHVPTDAAMLDLLDPRLSRRVVVTAGYDVPGATEDHVLCDLLLVSRTVKRPSNTMEIRAESDERLVIDGRPVTGARSFNQYSDGGQAIASLIQWLVPSAVVSERVPYAAFVAPGDTLLIDREDNVWSAIQDIADRIGAWVHHDGLGTFIIEPQPTLAGAATADFKVGVGGTITASESDFNREEFANTVAVTFQWYDGAQHTAYGYAEASTGPYSVAAIGRKVASVTIDRKGTANQAKAAAENMLKRAITRGRRLSIEVEHAPLWVRPGQTVTVQLVTGSQQRHFVKRIDFDIPSGRGHLSTRQPEDVSITTGE